jgi:hypothetical protein
MADEQIHFVLGVRAEPRSFHWAVVEGTQARPIIKAHDKADAPAGFEEHAALGWFRSRMLYLIDTYHPIALGVRYPEPTGRGGNRDSARQRSRVEGVVLETAHSCGLSVLTGALSTISKRLGTKGAKRYIESAELRGLDLSSLPVERREAVLVAVALLPAEGAEEENE